MESPHTNFEWKSQTLHAKANTGKISFHCQVCEKSLRDNLYMKAHTEEKVHNCQMFWRCFTQTLHEKNQNRKYQFACQVCKNSLREKLYLKNTHRGEILVGNLYIKV